MKALPRPTVKAAEILLACASTITDLDLHRRVRRQRNRITHAEAIYRRRGRQKTLYLITGTAHVGSVRGDEMIWVYDHKLSRKRDAARTHYDTLRNGVLHNTCPFCSQRKVKTLDHYLAKTTHPIFAVTPLNLVPSCSDCNKAKLAHVPPTAEEQVMHPYFDDANTARWLVAEVVVGTPPGITFSVREPSTWNGVKRARVKNHFELLGLAELYASHAGSHLSTLQLSLKHEFKSAGAAGLRKFLELQAKSSQQAHRNCWQAAMFHALAKSTWFCQHGYKGLL